MYSHPSWLCRVSVEPISTIAIVLKAGLISIVKVIVEKSLATFLAVVLKFLDFLAYVVSGSLEYFHRLHRKLIVFGRNYASRM
jgi:hypothetical protein